MPERFSEAWEFYNPDPEIAELVGERKDRGTNDHRKFVLRFEGDPGLESGRFFDGISFGKLRREASHCGAQWKNPGDAPCLTPSTPTPTGEQNHGLRRATDR